MKKVQTLGLIFIVVLTAIIYAKGATYSFLHWDDFQQVVDNPSVRHFNLKQLFSETVVGMYQPLTTLIYSLTAKLFELKATTFHWLSITFHCINVILSFILLRKVFPKVEVLSTLLAAAIFAFHPMQVESVVWISAFSTLLFCSLFLSGHILFLNYLNQKKHQTLIWVFLLFLLACLAKSAAVIFPLILLLTEIFYLKGLKKLEWKKYLPFFITSLVFGLLTLFSREGAGHLATQDFQYSFLDRLALSASAVLFYPLKFLWPIQLSAFYPYPEAAGTTIGILHYASLVIVVSLGIVLVKRWKFSKQYYGLLFYLIGIALVIQIFQVGNQLTTDRYIYLPMIGFLILIISLLKYANRAIVYGLFLLPIYYAFISSERIAVWENDRTLWEDVLQQYPKLAQAHNNLGSHYLEQQNLKQALNSFNTAIKYRNNYADAYANRGNVYSQIGQAEAALKDLNKSIQLKPQANAYFNRANLYNQENQLERALKDYNASLKLSPQADAYTNRALVKLKLKQNVAAFRDLEEALQLQADYHPALFLKGMAKLQANKTKEACQLFSKAQRLGNKKAGIALEKNCPNN